MSVQWYFYFLPLLAVWLFGGGLAIARWPRHPPVSALVLLSVCTMLVASVGLQIGVRMVARSTTPISSLHYYFAVLGLVNMLLCTVAWAAMLTAIFGWRHSPMQFSIRGIMILTLAVALLCAAGRVLVSWLGGLPQPLDSMIDQLPMAICWLCGGWLAIRVWSAHRAVSRLTLAAILLSAVSFLAFQIVWMSNLTSRTAYLVQWTSVLSGIIAPVVWALLLAAALGWRTNVAAKAAAESAPAAGRGP